MKKISYFMLFVGFIITSAVAAYTVHAFRATFVNETNLELKLSWNNYKSSKKQVLTVNPHPSFLSCEMGESCRHEAEINLKNAGSLFTLTISGTHGDRKTVHLPEAHEYIISFSGGFHSHVSRGEMHPSVEHIMVTPR